MGKPSSPPQCTTRKGEGYLTGRRSTTTDSEFWHIRYWSSDMPPCGR